MQFHGIPIHGPQTFFTYFDLKELCKNIKSNPETIEEILLIFAGNDLNECREEIRKVKKWNIDSKIEDILEEYYKNGYWGGYIYWRSIFMQKEELTKPCKYETDDLLKDIMELLRYEDEDREFFRLISPRTKQVTLLRINKAAGENYNTFRNRLSEQNSPLSELIAKVENQYGKAMLMIILNICAMTMNCGGKSISFDEETKRAIIALLPKNEAIEKTLSLSENPPPLPGFVPKPDRLVNLELVQIINQNSRSVNVFIKRGQDEQLMDAITLQAGETAYAMRCGGEYLYFIRRDPAAIDAVQTADCGDYGTLRLQNGTVTQNGWRRETFSPEHGQNAVALACLGDIYCILRNDGTTVSNFANYNGKTDVVRVAAGTGDLTFIKSDLSAEFLDPKAQIPREQFHDIAAILNVVNNTYSWVGITADGKLTASGNVPNKNLTLEPGQRAVAVRTKGFNFSVSVWSGTKIIEKTI